MPLVVERVSSLRAPARRVATIYAPGYLRGSGQQFVAVAAAGDDRTFVAETVSTEGTARFDEIRLDSSGKPGPLIHLRFELPGPSDAAAITPDGLEIATTFSFHMRSGIVVISTATGQIGRWAWSGPDPIYLAWSGDHRIDFTTVGEHRIRTLSTSAPAGDLGTSRALPNRFLRFAGVSPRSPWIIRQLVTTANGRIAFVTVSSWSSVRAINVRYQVVSINAVNGKPRAVLTRTLLPIAGNGEPYCGTLWADGSGRHVLVSCGHPRCLAGNPGCAVTSDLAPYLPYPGIPTAWGG